MPLQLTSWIEEHSRLGFIIVALLFCATGLLYSTQFLGAQLTYPDELDYLALANNLIDKGLYSLDGVTPSALRPPGYALLLAPLSVLPHEIHIIRLTQFLSLALAAWCLAPVCLTVSRADNSATQTRYRVASVLLIATFAYPVILYTAGTLFPQTMQAALLAIHLCLLMGTQRSGLRAVFIGLTTAGIVLCSPTGLLVLPLTLVFMIQGTSWSTRLTLLMGSAFIAIMSLWLLRNILVMDELILFSRNLAYNIDNAVLETVAPVNIEDREPASALEYGTERLLQIVSEPMVYLHKLAGFFAYRNDLHIVSEQSSLRSNVMFVSYYALLGLVVLRLLLVRLRSISRAEMYIVLLYLGTAVFHALVFTRIRYRIPFDVLLLPVALNAISIVLASGRVPGFKRAQT